MLRSLAARLPRLLAIVGLIASVGCLSDTAMPVEPPEPEARLRVVHAASGAPSLDVFFQANGITAQVGTAAGFGNSSQYYQIPAAGVRLIARPIGIAPSPSASLTLDQTLREFEPDASYSSLILGDNEALEIVTFEDDYTNLPAGEVRVRLVHGAPGVASFDFYMLAPGQSLATAIPRFNLLGFRGVSLYTTLPAGIYSMVFTVAGSKQILQQIPEISFPGGETRTVVGVAGLPGGLGQPLILRGAFN